VAAAAAMMTVVTKKATRTKATLAFERVALLLTRRTREVTPVTAALQAVSTLLIMMSQ
jgi:hypothetical protein